AKVLGTTAKVIDPMTYIAKGAGAGLAKIGDISAALKGVGTIDIPALPDNAITLPEGAVRLPDGTVNLPEGAAIPAGGIKIPEGGAVRLPEGTPLPAGAVDLGNGAVRLPEGTPAPAGAVELPEGAVKLPDNTPALPEGTVKLPTEDGAPARYYDPQGNVLDENGNVLGKADDGPGDIVDQPGIPRDGADLPRVDSPVREPAMAGAATHTADNAPHHLHLASDPTDLGDLGRTADDTTPPTRTTDNLPGSTADNLPGGTADNLPTNSVDTHAPGNNVGENLPGGRGPATETVPTREGAGDAGRGQDGLPGERGEHAGHPQGAGQPDGPHHSGDGSDPRPGDELADDTTDDAPDGRHAQGGDDNPYAGHEPDYSRPALLPAEGPLTLRDVRNTRDVRTRWERGEEFHRQMWGGGPERHYPVPTNSDPRYPVTASGGRKVDVPVDLPDGRTIAVEVKTYGPYRTITLKDGTSELVRNEVPLSKHIKEQIHKDIALRRMNPGYDPRWSFTHAGPSAELRAYLTKARIIFLEYGPAPKKDQWDAPTKKK
ncbi:hypothetical protein ACGF8A_19760, partial [Streptomyces sp. NPDC047706]